MIECLGCDHQVQMLNAMPKFFKLFPIVIVMMAIASPIFAQQSVRDLEQYLKQVRENNATPLPTSVLRDDRNEGKLLKTLEPYLSDPDDKIKGKAFDVTRRLGEKSKVPAVRQNVVVILIAGVKDKNTGIGSQASEALSHFQKSDFSVAARDSLTKLLQPQTPHLDRVVKLAGFIGEPGYNDRINFLLASTSSSKVKLACRLALARMGDAASIVSLRNKVNRATVNDDFIYDVVPDLIYTHNKEIYDFLVQVIENDDLQCESPDPDSEGKLLCAYKLMEYLAPAIEGQPLKLDQSSELDEKDYKAALIRLRAWLSQNRNFKINDSVF